MPAVYRVIKLLTDSLPISYFSFLSTFSDGFIAVFTHEAIDTMNSVRAARPVLGFPG